MFKFSCRLVAIFSTIIFLSLAIADDCKIVPSRLRKCPSPITNIVPKNYPAQIYYIPRMTSSETLDALSALVDGQVIALENIEENVKLAQNPKFKNKIFLVGNSSPNGKNANTAGILPMIPNPSGYQRDFNVFGFDGTTGTIIQNITKSDLDQKNYSICGLKVKQVDAGDAFAIGNSNLGGNIIGFPGGGCLVGEGMDSDLALKLCGKGNPIIRLNTSGASVGHIDELINIVPSLNNPPPCDYSITIPSMVDMKSILEQNKDDYFFDPQKKGVPPFYDDGSPHIVNDNGNGENQGKNTHEYLCKTLETLSIFKKLEESQNSSPPSNSPASSSKSVFYDYFINLFIENSYAGGKQGGLSLDQQCDDTPLSQGIREIEVGRRAATRKEACLVDKTVNDYGFYKIEPSKFICNKIKNKDILELMNLDTARIDSVLNKIPKTISGIAIIQHVQFAAKLSELKKIVVGNSKIQEAIDENIKILKANLPTECAKKNMFTSLPYLFNGSRSLNPNPSNLLVIGKTAFTPQQFNSKTSEFIRNKMKDAGLETKEINTYYQHVGGGNVHCLSNEIRGCSQ